MTTTCPPSHLLTGLSFKLAQLPGISQGSNLSLAVNLIIITTTCAILYSGMKSAKDRALVLRVLYFVKCRAHFWRFVHSKQNRAGPGWRTEHVLSYRTAQHSSRPGGPPPQGGDGVRWEVRLFPQSAGNEEQCIEWSPGTLENLDGNNLHPGDNCFA